MDGMLPILNAAGICTRAPARVYKTTFATGYIVYPRVVWSYICCNWCTWFLLARIRRLRGSSWTCVLVPCVLLSRCASIPHVTLSESTIFTPSCLEQQPLTSNSSARKHSSGDHQVSTSSQLYQRPDLLLLRARQLAGLQLLGLNC